MRNFCHPGKFRTLTINFWEVWPRQILLQIQSLDYVLETFWKRLKDILKTCYQEQINSMIRLEKVLKTSLKDVLNTFLQEVLKTFWKLLENVLARRLEDVLKTFLQDVLKTSWKRLEDVLKTSWKRLEDVLKTYDQDKYIGLDQDVLKTSSEDVWVRWIYSSWWRRLLKTKTKDVFIKTFFCWALTLKRHNSFQN